MPLYHAILIAALLQVSASANTCGLSRLTGKVNFGGDVAILNEFPWMVSLQRPNANDSLVLEHFCGGSIINDRWIITVAHCLQLIVDKKLLANISGLIGTNQLDRLNPERIYFDRAIIHENYDPLYLVDDIALLHTKNPIQMLLNGDRYQVNTICLGPFDQSTIMKEKPPDVALVVGWHDDNNYSLNTKVSNHLLKVMVSLIDHTQCVSLYQHLYLNISEKTLCYESRGKDSCRGDSGGPLLFKKNRRAYLVGLVSYGAGCGVYPGIYTDISQYLNWITLKLNTNL